jgi:hypothetical protein
MAIRRFILPLLAVAGATAQTTTATITRSSVFPAVGLASSETAEINVTNLANNPGNGTAASCAGSISFLNASGAAIGSPTTFTVTSGRTFSARLPYANTAASGAHDRARRCVSDAFDEFAERPLLAFDVAPDFRFRDRRHTRISGGAVSTPLGRLR